jgi:hypothetical protein
MPMNRPTAAELSMAVHAALEKAGRADTGASSYEQLVAGNVLKILERETAQAGTLLAEEQKGLRAYLGHDGGTAQLNRELCERITQGAEDSRWTELAALLRRTTLGKLAVDSPRFAAYRRAIDQQEQEKSS